MYIAIATNSILLIHDLSALKLPVVFFRCTIFSIILALALISGGIPSAINAADIKEDYIDPLEEFCNLDGLTDRSEEICNNLQTIRDAQIASAVSSIT